jgi:uncharacterized protein with GYD domain
MTYYMLQWSYKAPAIRAMTQTPQDRPAELRKVVDAFHGKLHHFFYAFGNYDGLAIVEFPDVESCAACSLTLSGEGGNAALVTTVLLTPGEGFVAMQKACATKSGYQAPMGYASVG